MEKVLRRYTIKRMDLANLRRSLNGALARSLEPCFIMFTNRPGYSVPDDLERLGECSDGTVVMEGQLLGEVGEDAEAPCAFYKPGEGMVTRALRFDRIENVSVSFFEMSPPAARLEA